MINETHLTYLIVLCIICDVIREDYVCMYVCMYDIINEYYLYRAKVKYAESSSEEDSDSESQTDLSASESSSDYNEDDVSEFDDFE